MPALKITVEGERRKWQPWQPMIVTNVGHDFHVVRFMCQEDYDHALLQGTWIIRDHYLIVSKWYRIEGSLLKQAVKKDLDEAMVVFSMVGMAMLVARPEANEESYYVVLEDDESGNTSPNKPNWPCLVHKDFMVDGKSYFTRPRVASLKKMPNCIDSLPRQPLMNIANIIDVPISITPLMSSTWDLDCHKVVDLTNELPGDPSDPGAISSYLMVMKMQFSNTIDKALTDCNKKVVALSNVLLAFPPLSLLFHEFIHVELSGHQEPHFQTYPKGLLSKS
ncbi:hypothetical protein Ancab_018753 [Ancistrocladus abbreviatus]